MISESVWSNTEPFELSDLLEEVSDSVEGLDEAGYPPRDAPDKHIWTWIYDYAFNGGIRLGGASACGRIANQNPDDVLNNSLKLAAAADTLKELSGGLLDTPRCISQTIAAFYARAKLDYWLQRNPDAHPDLQRGARFHLPNLKPVGEEAGSETIALTFLGLPTESLSIRELALLARLNEVTVRNAASPSRGAKITFTRESYEAGSAGGSRSVSRSLATPEDAMTFLLYQQRFCPTGAQDPGPGHKVSADKFYRKVEGRNRAGNTCHPVIRKDGTIACFMEGNNTDKTLVTPSELDVLLRGGAFACRGGIRMGCPEDSSYSAGVLSPVRFEGKLIHQT